MTEQIKSAISIIENEKECVQRDCDRECSKCGTRYPIGNQPNGCPNMVGFVEDNGRKINLCYRCLVKLGSLNEEEKDKFIEELKY